MGIQEIFVWYQQKIGAYDKQLWETKIEQREQRIYGLTHVQKRSAKPNTELIDLDLVRGSSFTKAKPQHGFLKVARLATLRCLFLPLYAKWWMRQTSAGFFMFTLFLYLVQMANIFVFYLYASSYSGSITEGISCMEIIIPILMAWLLSLIHSQIVATIPDKKEGRRIRRKKLQFADQIETLSPDSKSKRFSRSKNGPFNLQFKSYLFRRKYRRWLFRKPNVDDDGFESLNGNGSRTSDEELIPDESSQEKKAETVAGTSQEETIDLVGPAEPPVDPENSPGENTDRLRHGKKGDQDPEGDDAGADADQTASNEKCQSWMKRLEDTGKRRCSTDSETDADDGAFAKYKKQVLSKRRSSGKSLPKIAVATAAPDSTCDTENEALSSPRDWTGVTTNSEDGSSDLDDDVSDAAPPDRCSDCFALDGDASAFINPPSVKASCTIYEKEEIKKADLSMLDITSIIISKVEATPSAPGYFYGGIVVSTVLTLLPFLCPLAGGGADARDLWDACRNGTGRLATAHSPFQMARIVLDEGPARIGQLVDLALGTSPLERFIVIVAMLQRLILASMVFFLLAVAERTFKQRLLYAKLFSHLTSSRRARKSDIPHFRLNKVRNIKTWLSVRSYLKKRGPQRSVDVIVSTAFVVTLLLLSFLCAEILKETASFSQYYLEAVIWCFGLGVMLLRLTALGTKMNKKYRNLSVLITEQINLHLQIEQKPHKKDELTVANNVLKLAIDLLKELENPFKISGLSANPILYNITNLVVLSALSGVLSELLGFKLKLYKIKLK